MNFNIKSDDMIESIENSKVLLASGSSAGVGKIDLNMSLSNTGSNLAPTFHVSGKIFDTEYDKTFNSKTSQYPLDEAVEFYNELADKLERGKYYGS